MRTEGLMNFQEEAHEHPKAKLVCQLRIGRLHFQFSQESDEAKVMGPIYTELLALTSPMTTGSTLVSLARHPKSISLSASVTTVAPKHTWHTSLPSSKPLLNYLK